MSKRGPMAATDRRRQAGHKHPRHAGTRAESTEREEGSGAGKPLAHLFSDRRKPNAQGRRAF